MRPTATDPDGDGLTHVWRVGRSSISTFPSGEGWAVRLQRPEWGETPFDIEGWFTTLPEARAWCLKMAEVLVRDAADDLRQG